MKRIARIRLFTEKNGRLCTTEEIVAVERKIVITWANGNVITDITASPGLEQKLAIGLLATNGYDTRSEDITINHNPLYTTIIINKCMIKERKPNRPMTLGLSQIKRGLLLLKEHQDLLISTGCAHGALLRDIFTGAIVFAEDIRRHNALSKVIGIGIENDFELETAALFFTGRLTSEIVERCKTVGIPIICSMAVATNAAIQKAQEADMTLIGSGLENMWIYNIGSVKIVL